MKKTPLPKADPIQKLAQFWDTHDLTDFEDQLEEVAEPVFTPGAALKVRLQARDAKAIEKMAQAKGVTGEELVRGWVLERIARRNKSRRTSRRTG